MERSLGVRSRGLMAWCRHGKASLWLSCVCLAEQRGRQCREEAAVLHWVVPGKGGSVDCWGSA